MNKFASIRQIKGMAREQLLGKYGAVIFVTMFYLMIKTSLTFCTSLPFTSNSLLTTLLFQVISFGVDLLFGIFQMGLSSFYLNISSDRPFYLSDLFIGFKVGPDRAIKLTFILGLINLACMLPYYIYDYCFMYQVLPANYYILIGLLLVGELLYYLISLRFSFCYYLLVDLPSMKVSQVLKMSGWLMKGSYFRLIGLQLSFVPMYFLGFLSFGIGFLWVTPYVNTAYANFYLNVSEARTVTA